MAAHDMSRRQMLQGLAAIPLTLPTLTRGAFAAAPPRLRVLLPPQELAFPNNLGALSSAHVLSLCLPCQRRWSLLRSVGFLPTNE